MTMDTSNRFMVCLHGDKLYILDLPALIRGLNREEALLLAAWIVSMVRVLPGETTFEDVLKAVENT